MNPINEYYLSLEAPIQPIMEALRSQILKSHPDISEHWKYSMPFFYYQKKPLCYLRYSPKEPMPYIGFVDGNLLPFDVLIKGTRKRMKAYYVDPYKDIPKKELSTLLDAAMALKQ